MPPKIFNKFKGQQQQQADANNNNKPVGEVKQEVLPDSVGVGGGTLFDQSRSEAVDTSLKVKEEKEQLHQLGAGGKPLPKRGKLTLSAHEHSQAKMNAIKQELESGDAGPISSSSNNTNNNAQQQQQQQQQGLVHPITVNITTTGKSSPSPQKKKKVVISADNDDGDDAAADAAAKNISNTLEGRSQMGAKSASSGTVIQTAEGAEGLKFLHAHRDEQAFTHKRNREFFLNSDDDATLAFGHGDHDAQLCFMQLPRLDISTSLNNNNNNNQVPGGQQQQQQTSSQYQSKISNTASGNGVVDDQQQHGEELLSQLPPGRVGTLRIHQSGKVTLSIAGFDGRAPTLLDLSVCEAAGDDGGGGGNARNLMAIFKKYSNNGASKASEQQQNQGAYGGVNFDDDSGMVGGSGGHDDVHNGCYDIGSISKKLVCIPDFDE